MKDGYERSVANSLAEDESDQFKRVARWIVLTQVPFESASERDRKVEKIAQVLEEEFG